MVLVTVSLFTTVLLAFLAGNETKKPPNESNSPFALLIFCLMLLQFITLGLIINLQY